MNKDAIIEILTEELPPTSLLTLSQAFQQNVIAGLAEAKLTHGQVKPLATPRRLALVISQLANRQSGQLIEKLGPALAIAFDQQGQPTAACHGFARSCGISVDQLQQNQVKGRVIFCHRQKGKAVDELLPEIVTKALENLPINKIMRWGEGDNQFVRPAHSLLMLYGKKLLKASILGVESGALTVGHRFHAPKAIKIKQPSDYEAKLKKAYVIADFDRRQQQIKQQAQQLAGQAVKQTASQTTGQTTSHSADGNGAQLVIPDGLLEEVTGLVEWPKALLGQFDQSFLALPSEVLISVMEKHQKCFAVANKQGMLLPYFVMISNIDSKDPEQVIIGNQKVMHARLSDAAFFCQQDKHLPLANRVEGLKQVLFEKQLGSLYDKTQRLMILAQPLAEALNADIDLTERAALLAKADLLTDMVGEFPELQGTMGRYYAEQQSETGVVSAALEEQYLPRRAADKLPRTATGQVLAIADRVDTLVGIIGINKMPTGSRDPYGLRRAALGMIRILLESNLEISLLPLVKKACQLYDKKLKDDQVVEKVIAFIGERHHQFCLRQGFSSGMIAAVSASEPKTLVDFDKRLWAVKDFQHLPQADSLAAINKRVKNILEKNKVDIDALSLNIKLFENDSEKDLLAAIEQKQQQLGQMRNNAIDYGAELKNLSDLDDVTNQFFDQVMVMVHNKKIRENRLALLSQLRRLFLGVADISLL